MAHIPIRIRTPNHPIFDLVAEPVNPAPAAALFHSSADAMAPAMATVETKPAKEDRNNYIGNCMNEVSCDTYQYVQKYGVRIFIVWIISLLTYVSATIDFPMCLQPRMLLRDACAVK